VSWSQPLPFIVTEGADRFQNRHGKSRSISKSSDGGALLQLK
jgi:hypothetical protein